MSHPYDKIADCQCSRCSRERTRRAKQADNSVRKTWHTTRAKTARSRYVDPLDQGDNLGESPDC